MDGEVYSWGDGEEGQLGHENSTDEVWNPKRIEFLKGMKIVKLIGVADFLRRLERNLYLVTIR